MAIKRLTTAARAGDFKDPFEAPQRFRQAALEQQYGEENARIMQVGEVRGF